MEDAQETAAHVVLATNGVGGNGYDTNDASISGGKRKLS